MISVIVLAYNHAQYIDECLESIVSQKCNVPFEIIVGDDCSTDSTRNQILKFQQKYPALVRPIFPEKNLGPNANYINCFNHCTGKYIAFCEGDDYWIDPLKLQKQVDFLEANSQYGGVASRNRYFIQEEKKYIDLDVKHKIVDFKVLCRNNPINSQTVMFRKSLIEDLSWLNQVSIGDWAIHFNNANQLPYFVFNDITAIYRVHGNGYYSQSTEEQRHTRALELMQIVLNKVNLSKPNRILVQHATLMQLKRLINLKTKKENEYVKTYFLAGGSFFTKTILNHYARKISKTNVFNLYY